jgi:hypothetical protein
MNEIRTVPDAGCDSATVILPDLTESPSLEADLRAVRSRLGDLLAVLAMLAVVAGAGALVVVP